MLNREASQSPIAAVETSRNRLLRWLAPAVFVSFTVLAAWIKWNKLDSLLWQDPAWWLNEYARHAAGELPYRDFYWPYGPLSQDIFAWALRALGRSFNTVQLVVDLLSAVVVFFVYRIARRLMPVPLPEVTALTLVAVGITARTYFSLFSLISYTPSVHVAAAGLLMMMDAIIGYALDGRRRMAEL